MDIKALRYFSEVVRQNGFRRAVSTLHVTQPAISRAIQQLEDEFQKELLIRKPRGVRLTPEGEVLYRHAQVILRQVENMTGELRDLGSVVTGTLRIGLPPLAGSTFFGKVVTEFRHRYPNVQLHIAEYGSSQLERALIEGRIEVTVAMLPMETQGLATEPFVHDQLSLLCESSHALATRKKIGLAELADESFVGFPDEFKVTTLINNLCRSRGFEPTIAGRSSQLDLIVSMVTSGMGIALIPSTICRKVRSARLAVVNVVDPIMSYELGMVRHRSAYLSQGCRAWINVAAEVLQFRPDELLVP